MGTKQVHPIRRVLLSAGEFSISIAIYTMMKTVFPGCRKNRQTGVLREKAAAKKIVSVSDEVKADLAEVVGGIDFKV